MVIRWADAAGFYKSFLSLFLGYKGVPPHTAATPCRGNTSLVFTRFGPLKSLVSLSSVDHSESVSLVCGPRRVRLSCLRPPRVHLSPLWTIQSPSLSSGIQSLSVLSGTTQSPSPFSGPPRVRVSPLGHSHCSLTHHQAVHPQLQTRARPPLTSLFSGLLPMSFNPLAWGHP